MKRIRALEMARSMADLRKNLSEAYCEVFYLAQCESETSQLRESNLAYLDDYLSDIILEYKKKEEIEQANKLKSLKELPSQNAVEIENRLRAIEYFFRAESEEFKKISKKYTKELGYNQEKGIDGQQLHLQFWDVYPF